jgi:hypothetical protein
VEPLSASDIATCLRVLARIAQAPADPDLSQVRDAVDVAYRSGKKQRKVARRDERREHDRAVVATARRFREEIPDTGTGSDAQRFATGLLGGRRCYVCKQSYL